MRVYCSLVVALCILLGACSSSKFEPVPEGVDYTYLFNTKNFALKKLKELGKAGVQLKELTSKQNNSSAFDTAYLNATQIDWSYYMGALSDIDMCDSNYDKVFSMEQNLDTLAQTATIKYTPLYQNLPLTTMTLIFNVQTNEVNSMYAEYKKVSFWKTTYRTVTYRKDALLQVVEKKKPLFGNTVAFARELLFEVTPSANIITY
jgi:hypothetical protein